jgi:hypothetical protein
VQKVLKRVFSEDKPRWLVLLAGGGDYATQDLSLSLTYTQVSRDLVLQPLRAEGGLGLEFEHKSAPWIKKEKQI